MTSAYNNIYGDISVEYYLNEKGTWRVKAYTYIGERDDTYYYAGDNYNNYVAGVALTYKQDFDRVRKKKDKNNRSKTKSKAKSESNTDEKLQK